MPLNDSRPKYNVQWNPAPQPPVNTVSSLLRPLYFGSNLIRPPCSGPLAAGLMGFHCMHYSTIDTSKHVRFSVTNKGF